MMKQLNYRILAGVAVTGAVLAAAPLVCGAQTVNTGLPAGSIAAIASSVDDNARPVSLIEAVETAQRNLPSVIQARGSERSAAASIRAAKGAFIPTANLSGSTGRTVGSTINSFNGQLTPIGGNPWSYSNGVNFNLPLYDGGFRASELRRTNATADVANATVVAARFDAALQVKQQYYAALAARESEAAARAQLDQANQQLKASTARVNAGVATKSDSLRSIIQVGTAQLAVLSAQNDLRVANATLTRVMGSETLVTANPADTSIVPVTNVSEDELMRIIPDAPSVLLSESNLAVSQAAKRSQKSSYLPTISVGYGYSYSQSSSGFVGGNLFLPYQNNPNRQALTFNLSYPLFNGFTRELNAANASVAVDNATAALRDARLTARANLSTQLRALNNANARISVQLQSIAAAEEDLRVQQQRYALGASTLLDLLTSQTALNTARQALIQARFDARTAKAQLESLVGRQLQ
jgi:outer membrane protein